MDNPRQEKVAVVADVRQRFEAADAALLTEYRGLSVKAMAELRRQLRPVGGETKVYKNTLVRFAARELGADNLEALLVGPTAITFVTGDAAAAAKALRDYARTNQLRRVCMSDKSNALTFAHDLWQRVFREVRREYPEIESRHLYIDTLAMELVRDPRQFDVIVTCNLFGDIISDLGAQLVGGLGLAPSGNIHPGRTSLFEPVHGSAPNIAGKGIANPLASILSAAMMLEFLGWKSESEVLRETVRAAVEENVLTQELGGSKATVEVGDWIAQHAEA